MKLYRVDNDLSTEIFENLYISEFEVVKETEKGYWALVYEKRKFILKGVDGKRYAYITKKDAFNGFIKRKKRQILINKSHIQRAELGIILANEKIKKLINK